MPPRVSAESPELPRRGSDHAPLCGAILSSASRITECWAHCGGLDSSDRLACRPSLPVASLWCSDRPCQQRQQQRPLAALGSCASTRRPEALPGLPAGAGGLQAARFLFCRRCTEHRPAKCSRSEQLQSLACSSVPGDNGGPSEQHRCCRGFDTRGRGGHGAGQALCCAALAIQPPRFLSGSSGRVPLRPLRSALRFSYHCTAQ
mmetsp:Transcript_54570/g.95407  ORF Transcript_54570/g.95407 Transcript_54570/m.95407 type:complete len:204 (+) Transcript_54570:150-761(+)